LIKHYIRQKLIEVYFKTLFLNFKIINNFLIKKSL